MNDILNVKQAVTTGDKTYSAVVDDDNSSDSQCDRVDDSSGNTSDDYDTELESDSPALKKPENPFGETDAFIGRNVYIEACEKFGHVVPQRRILEELEKKTLNLAHRSMGSVAIRPLCVALVDNLRIENLILEDCDIGDDGAVYVAQLLLDNLVLSRLNLSSNSIGEDSSRALSLALANNKTLLHLNLSDNKINDHAAFTLVPGLAKNCGIFTLNLSKNKLGEIAGKAIGTALRENDRLDELNVSWNELRGPGTVGLLKALDKNTTLSRIDISWNGLGYAGSVAVANALKKCKTLAYLDISHNRIDWEGALVISKSLTSNVSLEVLKMGDNPVSTTGANDILQAVASEKSQIRKLDLMNVAILGETELLAIVIQRRRKFSIIHGGIVHTHDVLGQRKEREVTAMERVIEYMRRLGIRPVELLRAFDKSVSFNVSKKEFIGRLKKTGVGLHNFEMEALANAVASRGMENNAINYSKLVDAVQAEILLERNRKIAERKRRERRLAYHKRILDVRLPVEALSEAEEELSEQQTTLEGQSSVGFRSGSSMSNMSSHSMSTLYTIKEKPSLLRKATINSSMTQSMGKLPALNASPKTDERIHKQTQKSTFSMCAPLGLSTKKEKRVKKKRVKKKKCVQVTSWMSSHNT